MNRIKAEIISKKARRSISRFCYEECNAYCCRKGFLILSKEQLDLVTKNVAKDIVKVSPDEWSMKLSPACPCLIDNKCSIHDQEKRPKACCDYPLFLYEKTYRLSDGCLAVMRNKFYKFEIQMHKLGYKRVYE